MVLETEQFALMTISSLSFNKNCSHNYEKVVRIGCNVSKQLRDHRKRKLVVQK